MPSTTNKHTGFTIIELMVVVFIAAILAGLAVPSFKEMIDKSRSRTTAESILEVFRMARATAAEERIQVVICPLGNNNTTCGSAGDWGNGILVFRDNGTVNGTMDAGETIVLTQAFNSNIIVSNERPADASIVVKSSGWTPGEETSLLVCLASGVNKNGFRITLSNAGRVRVEEPPSDSGWPLENSTLSC